MPKKLSYEFVKQYVESFNYTLLSKEYKNSGIKLDMICDKGHEFKISWNSFQQGRRCSICYGSVKKTIDEIRECVESFGYTLLSKEYKGAHSKLDMICDKGHKFKMVWNNFQQRKKCPYCAGNAKKTIDEIRECVESFGYTLLSKEYKNANFKFDIQCNKGHKFETTWGHFHRGQRCPQCWYESSSSKPEKEIQDYIASIYTGTIINNDRNTILNPNTQCYLELDVYLPELNKAIEFNGIYWHSKDDMILKDRLKRKLCKKENIDLLIINENEWLYDLDYCYDKIRKFIK